VISASGVEVRSGVTGAPPHAANIKPPHTSAKQPKPFIVRLQLVGISLDFDDKGGPSQRDGEAVTVLLQLPIVLLSPSVAAR
jgi:hypothetical protein